MVESVMIIRNIVSNIIVVANANEYSVGDEDSDNE